MRPEPEFAEEYTKSERIRFIALGILIGAIVFLLSKIFLLPWLHEFADMAPCRKVFGIEGLTVLWYGLFVGVPLHAAVLVGAMFGWRGHKILRDKQFPPANEKVFHPTRIRRNAEARLIGYLHLSAFLPFFALSVWGGFQAQTLSNIKPGTCTSSPAAVRTSP